MDTALAVYEVDFRDRAPAAAKVDELATRIHLFAAVVRVAPISVPQSERGRGKEHLFARNEAFGSIAAGAMEDACTVIGILPKSRGLHGLLGVKGGSDRR